MKKKNIINLIKYHYDNNDAGFAREAYEVAKGFDELGDEQLSSYVLSLINATTTFSPQDNAEIPQTFREINYKSDPIYFPNQLFNDISGIINAIKRNIGINKFLFQGQSGTGKTETVKKIAQILNKRLFIVNFSEIIDSRLGQTQKNIFNLFEQINNLKDLREAIILFDEIDSIALDRTNKNDVREMGRVTSTMIKCLDNLNEKTVLIATTNLYNFFDKALLRRFDKILNFNVYSREDLCEIGNSILDDLSSKYRFISKNSRLFKKIIMNMDPILSPGELKNEIKSSIAFSNDNPTDYLRRFYLSICSNNPDDLKEMKKLGFTLRDIEILSNVSRSKACRSLKSLTYYE